MSGCGPKACRRNSTDTLASEFTAHVPDWKWRQNRSSATFRRARRGAVTKFVVPTVWCLEVEPSVAVPCPLVGETSSMPAATNSAYAASTSSIQNPTTGPVSRWSCSTDSGPKISNRSPLSARNRENPRTSSARSIPRTSAKKSAVAVRSSVAVPAQMIHLMCMSGSSPCFPATMATDASSCDLQACTWPIRYRHNDS